jgi:DNA-directed RNA polymerase subunit RPC12/RpoP
MHLVVKCPSCGAALPLDASNPVDAIRCGRCGRDIPLTIGDQLRADTGVDACPVCQGRDFYRRKDFDPKLGLVVIALGIALSAVAYWFGRDLVAYGVLGGAVLVDLIVYGRLSEVTVCYRCHTEFRGAYPRSAPAFDLHTADVLEQEYERRIGRR